MPSEDSSTVLSQSMLLRLITSIGLDNIKKMVFENRPMPSLLGNPRTKGFQDGKFEAATLEALLSLEDNFGKLSSEDINSMSSVSSMMKIMWDFFSFFQECFCIETDFFSYLFICVYKKES